MIVSYLRNNNLAINAMRKPSPQGHIPHTRPQARGQGAPQRNSSAARHILASLDRRTSRSGKTTMVWATNNLLAELPDGIMYEHPVLQQGFQLVEKVLCAKTTITLLLGILGAILLRKSLLGRQGTVSAGKAQGRIALCLVRQIKIGRIIGQNIKHKALLRETAMVGNTISSVKSLDSSGNLVIHDTT
eukprot:scaffold1371_cov132-Skeletonema_menzelii.AAC.1